MPEPQPELQGNELLRERQMAVRWRSEQEQGEDFIASGETQSLGMLDEALEQFFVLKKMPRIGLVSSEETSEGQCTKEENSELECGWVTLEG